MQPLHLPPAPALSHRNSVPGVGERVLLIAQRGRQSGPAAHATGRRWATPAAQQACADDGTNRNLTWPAMSAELP